MKKLSSIFGLPLFLLACCQINSFANNNWQKIKVATDTVLNGWSTMVISESVSPTFSYDETGGVDRKGSLKILSSNSELRGCWTKTYAVKGNQYYQFEAWSKYVNILHPLRRAFIYLQWKGADGQKVKINEEIGLLMSSSFDGAMHEYFTRAEPEFPKETSIAENGWTKIFGIYQSPPDAKYLEIQLHLNWVESGSAEWSGVKINETDKPKPRKVRLATVHYGPPDSDGKAKTPAEACALFEPIFKKAFEQKADLICLSENITKKFTGLDTKRAAEPIPGPSTVVLGRLAKKYGLYIVAGLVESDSNKMFNTAVLIGSDGTLVGKYRKMTLTVEESIRSGLTRGRDCPVFDTKFGKVGMMICWDNQSPYVARQLASKGAEIIAMPIAGGDPTLTRARAIENQVYIITSTYANRERWLHSGVIDYEGKWIAQAKNIGDVAVVEVDLNETKYWAHLGDLKNRMAHEFVEW